MRIVQNKAKALPLGLQQFCDQRNQICIIYASGGLGDYLMLRMILDDIKRLLPNGKLILSCASEKERYAILADHPAIDEFVNIHTDYDGYGAVYDLSHSASRYESIMAPRSEDHRSDIFASTCGFTLTTHDMHFNLSESTMINGKNTLDKLCGGSTKPKLAFCPRSVMSNKNLDLTQMQAALEAIREQDVFVFAIHTQPIEGLEQIPTLCDLDITSWMGVVNAIDYMVTVDTSHFHLAGGMKKPLTGIFTWADGKVYGKYFDFELVQKHRDNGDWPCGPCYAYERCPKTKDFVKPCLTELTSEEIKDGIRRMFARWPVESKR